jgi:uncharacterized membrane protein
MATATRQDYTHTNPRDRATAECDTLACRLTQNVGLTERVVSLIGGGVIGAYGLQQRSLPGVLLAAAGGALLYRGITGHCHCYGALGISTSRNEDSATAVPAQMGFKVEQSLIIDRPAQDLYDRWHQLSTLPRIMRHLDSVTEMADGRSHWVAKGPLGIKAEWNAERINDDRPRLIAWRSLPDSAVDTAGSVHFVEQTNGRGTRLTVSLKYNPPGGQVGASLAWLFGGGIEQEIADDLRRFKQLMETGEIATTEGQPSGR